ncbi:hypothetical protein GCM10027190_45730 [Spirosoma areae]
MLRPIVKAVYAYVDFHTFSIPQQETLNSFIDNNNVLIRHRMLPQEQSILLLNWLKSTKKAFATLMQVIVVIYDTYQLVLTGSG